MLKKFVRSHKGFIRHYNKNLLLYLRPGQYIRISLVSGRIHSQNESKALDFINGGNKLSYEKYDG